LLKMTLFRSKKFIIAAILAAVVLTATIGGVALASNGDDDAPRLGQTELMDKVAGYYEQITGAALDTDALLEAFTQARQELGLQARERLQQRLVDEGIITQGQLDELEAWLEARPDSPLTDEFKEWLEARPDIGRFGQGDGHGFRFNLRPFGERSNAGRFGGPHGFCLPDDATQ